MVVHWRSRLFTQFTGAVLAGLHLIVTIIAIYMEQNIEIQTQSAEEAEKCGMTVSDYLLACAYNYRPKPRLSKEETDLLQNLDNCRSDLVKYTSALHGMSTKQRMILFNQVPFMVGWLKELGNIVESVCQFLNAVKERNKIPSNEKSEEL